MDSKVRRQQTAHSLCKINQAQVGRLFQDAQSSGHEKPSILCFLVSRALVDDEDIGANLLSQQDSIVLTSAKVCELPAQFPSGNPNLDPIWRTCRPIPDDVGAFRALQFNNDRTRYDDPPFRFSRIPIPSIWSRELIGLVLAATCLESRQLPTLRWVARS